MLPFPLAFISSVTFCALFDFAHLEYCYYDFWVSAGEKLVKNPEPEQLAEWILHCFEGDWKERDYINIILPACNAMVILNGDDLYMILCNPDKQLMDIISQLAGAEGFFVYKAPGTQK